VIQVSHDLDQAAEISHRILLLGSKGTIVALGKPEQVYTPDHLRQAFRVETKIERNPYTGSPRPYPLSRTHGRPQKLPRTHLFCGGGSGSELMRRLSMAGAEVSVGPVNRGDSDQLIATALELNPIIEEPFCPISSASLLAAKELCLKADLLLIAPTAWGSGNQICLDLVIDLLAMNKPVVLVDPKAERDFTSGMAWKKLQAIMSAGGMVVEDALSALDILEQLARKGT